MTKEEMMSVWCKFLDYVTNGKMSKPNYTLRAMKEVFDERLEKDFVRKKVLMENIQEIEKVMDKVIESDGVYYKVLKSNWKSFREDALGDEE